MRWQVLTVCASAWTFMGCGALGTTQVGLANAPGLGGAAHLETNREGLTDVIANGRESCARTADGTGIGDGPLRHRVPPCETETRPVPSSDLAPPWIVDGGQSLVLPWLEHFYTGWPCHHLPPTEPAAKSVAWAVTTSDGATCEK